MQTNHPLINLAGDNSRGAREALVGATVDKLLGSVDMPSPTEQRLFSEILVKLYVYARHDIRARLSAALATSDWAPVALVRELALDSIEIAQPIIAFCPTITEDILIEVIEGREQEHRLSVAQRADIGEGVCAKLIDTRNAIVIGTLAKNASAKISSHDFHRAITHLKDRQDDLDAMIQRHDLPPSLVALAYSLADEKTRSLLSVRLPAKLKERLTRLTSFIASDAAEGHIERLPNQPLANTLRRRDDKSAMPTAGSLIAALMRSDRDLFFNGLSTILSLSRDGIERQVLRGDPQQIALVARAANFDMSLVRTIFDTLHAGLKPWSSQQDNIVAMTWMRFSPMTARMHFASACMVER
jgi:uncharacterized protein (DUF2336 family)